MIRSALIFLLVLAAALPTTSRAIENPSVRNPVGSGIVPPSSSGAGLIKTPNPIDTSYNRVITGNVGGGKHFRGVVPYGSTSDFGASTGSGMLDSFLRRSIGSTGTERYMRNYVPFYSQTGTVTTTRPGSTEIIRPPSMATQSRPTGIASLPPLPKSQPSFLLQPLSSPRTLRPMSMTTQQMEQAISSEVDTYLKGITIAENRRYLEQRSIEQQIRPTGEKAIELDKSISATQKPQAEPLELLPELKTQTFQEQPPQSRAKSDYEQMDVYERMKLQFDRLKKGVIELPTEKQTEAAADAQRESAIRQVKSGQAGKTDGSVAEQSAGVPDVTMTVAKAAQIRGPHRTFASFAKDRFNQSMRSAEEYLKRGKYYRAADAYTLALIYKSNDPLAYAGKSHALFAAGEYMSSGMFLLRALRIFPEYATVKVDLEYMLGDRDKIDDRIVDIERWYQKSGAVELKFLLAYVYYQMDRFEQATEAIDAVYESMPDAPAIAAFKDAIYDAVKSNER